MKKNFKLTKNVPVTIEWFTDYHGVSSFYFKKINDVPLSFRLQRFCKDNLESALNCQFNASNMEIHTIVDIEIKNEMLIINGTDITELSYQGLGMIYYALSKPSSYSYSISTSNMRYGWSGGLGRHLQNLSAFVDSFTSEDLDWQKTIKELTEKYKGLVKKNTMVVIEVVEHRGGKIEYYNQIKDRIVIGYYEDNFDTEIWQEIGK